MKGALTGDKETVKFVLYSGHDTTIRPLLRTLYIHDYRQVFTLVRGECYFFAEVKDIFCDDHLSRLGLGLPRAFWLLVVFLTIWSFGCNCLKLPFVHVDALFQKTN